MKKVIIDTDILSYYFKGYLQVKQNLDDYIKTNGFVYISRITVFEALSGLKAKNAIKQIQTLRDFLSKQQILEVDENTIELSSDIFATLKNKGIIIANNDILIAGTAIQHSLTLSTNNTKHYSNIVGLDLVNWSL